MLKELGININELLPYTLGVLPIILAFSPQQIQAILDRDGQKCQFPGKHVCNDPGHLKVHHIISQEELRDQGINPDQADLAVTVCKNTHWPILHQTKESWREWVEPLRAIIQRNTENAVARGWVFPRLK